MRRLTLISFLCIFQALALYAEKQTAAVYLIESNSPRALRLAALIEEHLINILDSTGVCDPVNPASVRDQTAGRACVDERCMLSFAVKAGIKLIIKGSIDDRGDSITLSLKSYGADAPYGGKIFYSYSADIRLAGKYSAKNYSYICEEHAARFVSGILAEYLSPVKIHGKAGRKIAAAGADGVYDLYRISAAGSASKKAGKVKITNGILYVDAGTELQKDDYLLLGFRDRADYLREFYHGRKKEIVMKPAGVEDTLLAVLFTVPASAAMPLAAPYLGYYMNDDWTGMALWAVNAAPWLYVEFDGLLNRPDQYRARKKDIPSSVTTNYRFGIYMLFLGGSSLFADAFSHESLKLASDYQGKQQIMGSPLTAGYLALAAGGGGHFYRGSRVWGYFYFHLDNILLYLTIREFSPDESYIPASHSYKKKDVNETRAFTLAALFGAVKITEIIHAVMMKDRIDNGETDEQSLAIVPFIYENPATGLNLGIQFCRRF